MQMTKFTNLYLHFFFHKKFIFEQFQCNKALVAYCLGRTTTKNLNERRGNEAMNIKLLALAVASATLLTACGGAEDGDNGRTGETGPQGVAGAAGQDGANGQNGADGQDLTAVPMLTRLATTPEKAELTGMYKTDNGEMFFNIQHPSSSLPGDEGLAAVGAWVGVDLDNLDPRLESIAVPTPGSADAQTTKVVTGSFQVLGREGETYSGDLPFGLGNIVTADGTA